MVALRLLEGEAPLLDARVEIGLQNRDADLREWHCGHRTDTREACGYSGLSWTIEIWRSEVARSCMPRARSEDVSLPSLAGSSMGPTSTRGRPNVECTMATGAPLGT